MEFRKFRTSGGHEIVLRPYLTGRQMRELKNVFLSAFEVTADGQTIKSEKVRGTLVTEMEDKKIELVCLSCDGKSENVREAILDLPAADYAEVIEEIEKICSFSEEKKT